MGGGFWEEVAPKDGQEGGVCMRARSRAYVREILNTLERGEVTSESSAGARALAALPERLRAAWAPRCGRAQGSTLGPRSALFAPRGIPGPPRAPAGSAVNVKELGACFRILFRFSFLGNLQPGPLGLQETAFRKGMRTWARDGLAQAKSGGEGCLRSGRARRRGKLP